MYPDTTRSVYMGISLVEGARPANMYAVHTMNEPAHTLNNGIIIPEENTGTRMKDNGQARGKRSSSLRIQAYMRLDEVGLWLESGIGAGITTAFAGPQAQLVALTGSPTGGTFTLKLGTLGTPTANIAYNALFGAVQSALEATPDIDPGDIAVTGTAPNWTVRFLGPKVWNQSLLIGDGALLTGGTTPAVAVSNTTVTGGWRRRYKGGVGRGLPLYIEFFNGLYWRAMKVARVNTMNIQGFGNQMAMVDMEIIGKASRKISAPTPIAEDDTYKPMDVPMQYVQFAGVDYADMDRMSVAINNNLTQRSLMDKSTSVGRTRFGNFGVTLDGMADYAQYPGSLYEAFEENYAVGAMDLFMLDDIHPLASTPVINPYIRVGIPHPLLADTSEGDDSTELVQMIKGRGQYDNASAAGIVIDLVNDKPTAYYDAS